MKPAIHPDVEVGVSCRGTDRAATRPCGTASYYSDGGGCEIHPDRMAGEPGVFRALLCVIPAVYAAFYVVAAILSASFGTRFDGVEPFDHISFSPATESADRRPLVDWLTTVVTLTTIGPWLIYFGLGDAHRATDCGQAVLSIHFFLTTTVTQRTPDNWVWWSTVMPCGIFMGRMAEFLCSRKPRRRRKSFAARHRIEAPRSMQT